MRSDDWLSAQAEVHPRRLALAADGQYWTFEELDEAVDGLASHLAGLPVRSGDRVALWFWPGAPLVLLIYALTRLGAVIIPLNTRLTPAELAPILDNAEPAWILHQPGAPLPATPAYRQKSWADILAAPRRPLTRAAWDWEALHTIIYTSGTTGIPKGVMLALRQHWWSAMGFALQAGVSATDRWLHTMPLFHVGGLSILFRSVIQGSGVILLPRFDVSLVAESFRRDEITLVSLVPTMLKRLLDAEVSPPKSLRLVLLGGAPAAPDLIEQAWQRGYPVAPTYGLTETASQIAILDPANGPSHRGTAGRATVPTQVEIRDGERTLPPNTPGEIYISGPTVALGYWRQPELTEATFRSGWLKTGDIGQLDSRHYLTVLDRRRDLIIRGGENIYPTEVEEILKTYPAIADAAVFGRPDPEWGQRVAAALQSVDTVDLEELRHFLSSRLASYKMPTEYYFVDQIPRTASGKILRTQLIAQLAEHEGWDYR